MCGFKILQKGQNEVTGQVSFDDRFFTFVIKFPCFFEDEECQELWIGFTEISIDEVDNREKVPKLLLMDEQECLSPRAQEYLEGLGIKKAFKSQVIEKDAKTDLAFFVLQITDLYPLLQRLKSDFKKAIVTGA